MIDVHAPHERMEGIRDFLLHLLTITVGLLIALSLEGLVEWRHHVHLVDEANRTLRVELAYNSKQLASESVQLVKETAQVDKDLETLRAIQRDSRNKAAQNASLSVNFSGTSLRDTAWRTAQATGALGYMDCDQSQRYSGAYQSGADFEQAEKSISEDTATFLGLVEKFDLNGPGRLTAAQASDIAQCLGVLRTHILFVHIAMHVAKATDDAVLEGKPEPTGFHESLETN